MKDLQRMLQSKALLIDSRTHLCELYLFKEESYDGIYIIFSVKNKSDLLSSFLVLYVFAILLILVKRTI